MPLIVCSEEVDNLLGMDQSKPPSTARRVLVGIAGGIVLLAGIAMIVLPGPAFVVIPVGLAILASEFEWARRWAEKTRQFVKNKWHRKREVT